MARQYSFYRHRLMTDGVVIRFFGSQAVEGRRFGYLATMQSGILRCCGVFIIGLFMQNLGFTHTYKKLLTHGNNRSNCRALQQR